MINMKTKEDDQVEQRLFNLIIKSAQENRDNYINHFMDVFESIFKDYNLLNALTYAWQQNVGCFYKAFNNTEVMDFFKSKFEDNEESLVVYRGIHFNELCGNDLNRDILSCSINKTSAINFALYGRSRLHSSTEKVSETHKVLLEYKASKILDIRSWSVDDDQEVLIMNYEITNQTQL